jgi:hypothetical protein
MAQPEQAGTQEDTKLKEHKIILCAFSFVFHRKPFGRNSMRRIFFILLAGFTVAVAQSDEQPRYALLDLNNFTSWLGHNGISNRSPKGNVGGKFPRGTAQVVYQDGIVWGGKAYVDANKTVAAPFGQLIRVGGATYSTGSRPGRIIGFGANAATSDPLAAEARVYRIRRDYFAVSEAELRRDAAEVFEVEAEQVTTEQTQAVRAQYERDWNEWPVAFGAPFIDRNRNGVYDPPPPFSASFTAADLLAGNYDEPGIASLNLDEPAHQVLWTVYNDLDTTQRNVRWGSEPLGLEVQVTQWAFKSALAWGSYFYRRVRMINKGGAAINAAGEKDALWLDDMYLCQWVDADLGDFSDDLAGCDTTLSLGYVYNAVGDDQEFLRFHLRPPAIGYALMQGPIKPQAGAVALFDMKQRRDWKNIGMNAFIYHATGDAYSEPVGGYETGALVWYKVLRGFAPIQGPESYFDFPPGMRPGPFPFAGDPVAKTGHIDGVGFPGSRFPGERRFQIHTGPFALAPGDTQEAVVACVAGMGADRLSSVSVMKFLTKHVRQSFPSPAVLLEPSLEEKEESPRPNYYTLSLSFPNPFTTSTSFDFTLPQATRVRVSVFDLLGREVALIEDRFMNAGRHRASWEGRDQQGRALPSGVYFYRLIADHIEITRKLVLAR